MARMSPNVRKSERTGEIDCMFSSDILQVGAQILCL